MDYARTITLKTTYEDAVPKVKEAFKAKGFGALTEVDVRATLWDKLGEEMEPYLIIGACNPDLAHRALGVEREVGLLLPCNVVVRQVADAVMVQALDASVIASVPGNPNLEPIAAEAGRLMAEALEALVTAEREAAPAPG